MRSAGKFGKSLKISLVDLSARPLVLVLSSGFMMTDRAPSYGERNRRLVRETGYSILMAPSADIDEATEISVAELDQYTQLGLCLGSSQFTLQRRTARPLVCLSGSAAVGGSLVDRLGLEQ